MSDDDIMRLLRDDMALRERGIIGIEPRHLPGKHDQSSHGRKGPGRLAKAATKKAAIAVAKPAPVANEGKPIPAVPKKTDDEPAAGPLNQRQIEALLPKRGGWTTSTRAKVTAVLKETPQGRALLRTVDSFQSGSSVNIPRLRTDIEKVLSGDPSVPPGRVEAVRNLLGAIAQSDAGDRPLYRGMIAPETVDEVLARYKEGDPLDLSLASFSSDKKLAAEFSIKGAGQRVSGKKTRTPVLVEWLTGPKHALPIENVSKSGVFANEKEWIGAGQYRIVKAFPRTRNGVTTVVLQVEQVGTW